MNGCQTAGQTRVLHTYLDRDGMPLGVTQAQQSANQIAQTESADVMQHDNGHNDQSTSHESTGIGCNDDGNNKGDSYRRECRKIIYGFLGESGPEPFDDESDNNRQPKTAMVLGR